MPYWSYSGELCVPEEMPVIEVVEVAEKPKEFRRMEFISTLIEVGYNFLEVTCPYSLGLLYFILFRSNLTNLDTSGHDYFLKSD